MANQHTSDPAKRILFGGWGVSTFAERRAHYWVWFGQNNWRAKCGRYSWYPPADDLVSPKCKRCERRSATPTT
jgi:hypothetical protein